jgi:hypothetical protein
MTRAKRIPWPALDAVRPVQFAAAVSDDLAASGFGALLINEAHR